MTTTTASRSTPGALSSGTTQDERRPALTDDMLARFAERAPVYDRENRFFDEDLKELRASGYLDLALPEEYGGPGRPLSDVVAQQRRLAYHAPATAIAVNMHFYWTGVAADLLRAGDESMRWVLERASRGEVFAAGHGESGNDVGLMMSTTQAQRVEGGWEFSGRKIFGSLSPVWDWFGVHGMDTSDPENPQVVHGFIHRSTAGYRIEPTWDVMGMRATQSHDTVLERTFVADEHVALVCPAGFAGAGMFQVAIFAWALLGFANVYTGIAQRAFDITVERAHQRTSLALTRSMAYHPEVQHEIAEMRMALEAVDAHLGRVSDDWSAGVDHGGLWPLKIITAKHAAVTQGWKVVDTAMELSGGAGIFRRSEIERLFRDARLGRIHPANSALTHELVAKFSLGIDPDEQPRWG